MPYVRYGFVINPKDLNELQKLSIKMEVSVSSLIRAAIKCYLNQLK